MKKLKNIIGILIINIVLIILSNSSFATTGKINSETVRMRKGPSTDSGIETLLSIDEKVEILSEEGDWYKVKYKGVEGYISKSLVDTENTEKENEENKPTEEPSSTPKQEEVEENEEVKVQAPIEKNYSKGEKVVLNNSINLKLIPVIYSTNIVKIDENTEITIIEIMNNWCKVEANGKSGWVRKFEINKDVVQVQEPIPEESKEVETSTTPVEEEKEEPKPEEIKQEEPKQEEKVEVKNEEKQNKIGYVNVDTVNIRKETNTSCEILGQLSINTEVEILESLQGWYKIKSGKFTGYIASKYISDEKVPEITSRSATEDRTPAQSSENVQEEKVEEAKEVKEEVREVQQEAPKQESNSGKGAEIVAKAKTYLGYKYVSGGASPETGFDCSGFTTYIFKQFGISLYRTSTDQAKNGIPVEKSNLQLGDILIFNNDGNTKIGHVGIYIGDNQFIHASNPRTGVKITSLSDSYYVKRYVGARRVI